MPRPFNAGVRVWPPASTSSGVPAPLWAWRASIDPSALEPRLREFDARWTSLEVVEVSEPLVQRAAALAIRHGLRGCDSIHLAAALAVHETLGESVAYGFAATDGRLHDAARLAGLTFL